MVDLTYYTTLVDTGTSCWVRSFRGSQRVEMCYVTRLIDIYEDVFWGLFPFFIFSFFFLSYFDLSHRLL
jgi:hypothetical protein